MDYEWDKAKARSNRKKHGTSFADAVVVLEDEQAITVPDDNPNEERFITIGMDAFGQVLVVVYTWRGEETIRIVSARKATRAERQQYEEG